MPVPPIEAVTTGGADNAGSWSLNKPSGVAVGDLLQIVLSIDPESDNKTPDANPTGFDLEASGSTTSSASIYLYSRIANGAEGASFGAGFTLGNTQWTGKCYRISGVNQANPINVVGTPVHSGNSTQKTAASATTTVNNCRGFAALAADGGDTSPFSTEADNGWVEDDDLQSSTDASGMGLSISTKEQTTAGAMGDCIINLAVSDGGYTLQWAVEPADLTQTLTVPFFDDSTDTFYGIVAPQDVEVTVPLVTNTESFINPIITIMVTEHIYPLFKEYIMGNTVVDLVSNDVRLVLIDINDYTYSATDEFLSDIPAGAIVGTSDALTFKSISGGNFSANTAIFQTVTGDPVAAMALYLHTGTGTTSRLIAYMNTGGILLTPDGGEIQVAWSGNILEI